MTKRLTTIGSDVAKTVFQIHGSDEAGHPVLKKQITVTVTETIAICQYMA